VLSPYDGVALRWSFDGLNPAFWRIEQSDDGVSDWTEWNDVEGSTFYYNDPDTDEFYRVIGLDGANNPITDYSNIINVP
jgi:hypothetical protein